MYFGFMDSSETLLNNIRTTGLPYINYSVARSAVFPVIIEKMYNSVSFPIRPSKTYKINRFAICVQQGCQIRGFYS